MTAKKDPVVVALGRVQRAVRSAGDVPPEKNVRTQRVSGTRGREARYVAFDAVARDAVRRATAALAKDERYEHIQQAADAVWDFAGRVAAEPTVDFVAGFVTEHERPVQSLRCYVPVEHLVTRQRWRVDSVEFLPVDADEVPPPGQWFRLDPPTTTVGVVDVTGTSPERVAGRARELVSAALTAVRVAVFVGQRGVADEQLRFRIGEAYAFGESVTGWHRRDDGAFDLDAGPDLGSIVAASPTVTLLDSAPVDIASAMRLALGWLERAMFISDPLIDVLFSFFALEAVLGRKSDPFKGDSLAVRRITLDHDQTGGFSDPNRLWLLYDQVRSAAVHGSRASDVDHGEARQFRRDVTATVEQALRFASDRGFTRRGQLLEALDTHPDLPRIAEWLVVHAGSDWQPYIDLLLSARDGDPPSGE